MNTPFITIQGTLFNLDGIVSVRVELPEDRQDAEVVVETRKTQHCFSYPDSKAAKRVVEQVVAKLKSDGYDVPGIS